MAEATIYEVMTQEIWSCVAKGALHVRQGDDGYGPVYRESSEASTTGRVMSPAMGRSSDAPGSFSLGRGGLRL
jgi:hypothetical protein